MQAGPEHQQNDADLGQLARHSLVGDVARRERPDDDAGHQVADQRRQFQPVGHGAQDEGQAQADDQHGDERCVHLSRQRSGVIRRRER